MSVESIVLNLVAVRMKSTRLLGKALLPLEGKTVIGHLIDRVSRAEIPKNTIICTSNIEDDNLISDFARQNGFLIVRGHPVNVLHRFIEAAEKYKADHIVRITGDNPLTDPFIIDEMTKIHIQNNSDYTYTEDTPHGTRPEIISLKAMKKCLELAEDPNSTEYMTMHFKNYPQIFKHVKFRCPSKEYFRPNYTVTLDTSDDYDVLKKIYEELYKKNKNFDLLDLIRFLDSHPEIDHESRVQKMILNPSVNTRLKLT